EQPHQEVWQAGAVDLPLGLFFVASGPGIESSGVLVACLCTDAPGVPQPPGLAALCGRLRDREQGALAYDLLPEELLLRAGEQQRKLRSDIGIERILVEPLDKGAEGKNVRGFPDREAGCRLLLVEFSRQRLCEAPIRRQDNNACGM